MSPATGGTTREARQRIAQARTFRESREPDLRGASQGRPQARATLHGSPSPAVLTLLERSGSRLGLSMRGVDRALRVARTIADLAGEPELLPAHLAEALSFRLTGFGVELRGGPGGSALEL